jgi:hypothetical protein
MVNRTAAATRARGVSRLKEIMIGFSGSARKRRKQGQPHARATSARLGLNVPFLGAAASEIKSQLGGLVPTSTAGRRSFADRRRTGRRDPAPARVQARIAVSSRGVCLNTACLVPMPD